MGHIDSPLCSYCKKANEMIKNFVFLNFHSHKKCGKSCLELQSTIVGFHGFIHGFHDDQILINSILLTFKMFLYKNRESKRFNITQIVKNIKS